ARLPGTGTVPASDLERIVQRVRSRSTVIPFEGSGDIREHLSGEASRAPSRAFRLVATVAALCVPSGVAAWLFATRDTVYATQTAELRSVRLEDGSRIDLGARTRVRVDL